MVRTKYDSYSREQLIDKIKELEKQRYGLVWEDKDEEVAKLCINHLPVLTHVSKREIFVDADLPRNIIIEGDNYHSLYTLNFTHKRKIDVIYIDPPYNTGNRDFMYNDKFVIKEDSYRHSKWLSFMSKRLKLCKYLLKETGIIFISIDDNELAQTIMLCNKIFGQNNFIGNFVWKRRSGANDPKNLVSTDHEYIICYKKSEKSTFKGIKKDFANYKNPDNDPRGNWMSGDLTCGKTKQERPNLFYDIVDPKTGIKYKANPNRVWRFEKKRMQKEIKENKILFPKQTSGMPQYKRFANEVKSMFKPLSTWIESSTQNIKQIEYDIEEYGVEIMQTDLNQTATKELRNIFGKQVFNYPKPLSLILGLLKYSTTKSSIILDFFAGSGTTGHAVLKLNQEDGGDRQFILCTNNENNICELVTYPRIKKVIKGYNNNKQIKGNLRYYKTDFVPQIKTDNDKRILVTRATEILCLAENTFELVAKSKKQNEFAIFRNACQFTAIIYDEDAIDKCKMALLKLKPNINTIIYVFSYDHQYNLEDFDDLNFEFEVKPIPEVILNVYRKNAKLIKK